LRTNSQTIQECPTIRASRDKIENNQKLLNSDATLAHMKNIHQCKIQVTLRVQQSRKKMRILLLIPSIKTRLGTTKTARKKGLAKRARLGRRRSVEKAEADE